MFERTVGPWWIIISKSAFDYLYVIAELQKFTWNYIYTSPTTFLTSLTSTFSICFIKKKPPNIFKEWLFVFSNVNNPIILSGSDHMHHVYQGVNPKWFTIFDVVIRVQYFPWIHFIHFFFFFNFFFLPLLTVWSIMQKLWSFNDH